MFQMPSGTLPGGFTFVAPLTVLGVISLTGPTTGGKRVTVWGTEFIDGCTVTFDGVAATGIVVLTPFTISCIIPAHAAGLVDVIVNDGTRTATKTGAFTYVVAPPEILSVWPDYGNVDGGDSEIIYGTGFVSGATIDFGGSAATSVVFIDSNHLSCVTPAHAAGFVYVKVTNPDTQFDTIWDEFEFRFYAFVDPNGWWFSDADYAGGSEVISLPSNPKSARQWSKLSGWSTILGGSPAASVVYKNSLIYAGDDYTSGTLSPSIRIFDGLADRLMERLPNTPTGAIPKAILSMLLVGDMIYITTWDSGTTSADFSGRVFAFDPLAATLTLISPAFSGGEVPYALAWHMNRLWVGTNKGNGTAGKVYFFRPDIDEAWTLDHTLSTESLGGATSMRSYKGKLYVGTDNAAAARGKVLARDTDGTWAVSDTGTGGTAAVGNGYLSMMEFEDNLYASYWNADTPSISLIKKFDGTTWTTSYTATGVNIRPYIVEFFTSDFLYAIGGGAGLTASLIRTEDGATWQSLTPYLAGPHTKGALPIFGLVNA